MTLDVQIHDLSIGNRRLLGPLHIRIPSGTVHTLMGASGSGKSSLLAAIAGLLPAGLHCQARLHLNGVAIDAIPAEARRVGLMFQDDLLFAHMTVRENLLFALPRGLPAEREAAVQEALRRAELPDVAHADPATLSGGQRARIALMRALLAQPQAMLLDEPFARLDLALRARVRAWVFDEIRQRGIAALLVTHDPADVADPDHLTLLPGHA